MKVPLPSFVDRPLPYLVCYLLVLLWACLWPLNFFQPNQVSWEPGGGLRFTPPATAYTVSPATKLATLREWTILLDAKSLPPMKHARILSYSLGNRRFNLNVDQLWDNLLVRIRTVRDQKAREIHADKLFAPGKETRFILAIVYNGEDISLYVDGTKRTSLRIGALDTSSWDRSFPLVFASHADGKFPWNGIVYNLTVFDRALTQSALNDATTLLRDTPAVTRYRFDGADEGMIADLGMAPSIPVSVPSKFVPSTRTILQSPRDYWPEPGRPYVRDIIANILIYMPIGFLLSVLMARRGLTIVVIAVAGVGVSIMIEILQAYLPTRNSSMMDLLMNTAGTLLGVYVQRKGWMEQTLATLNVSFRPHRR